MQQPAFLVLCSEKHGREANDQRLERAIQSLSVKAQLEAMQSNLRDAECKYLPGTAAAHGPAVINALVQERWLVLLVGAIDNYAYLVKKYCMEEAGLDPVQTQRLETIRAVSPLNDAQVVAALYRKLGPTFMGKIKGSFAFVLVDSQLGQVLACSDPEGSFNLWQGHLASDRTLVLGCCISPTASGALEPGSQTTIGAGEYKFGWRSMPSKYISSSAMMQERLQQAQAAAMQALQLSGKPVDVPSSAGSSRRSTSSMSGRSIRPSHAPLSRSYTSSCAFAARSSPGGGHSAQDRPLHRESSDGAAYVPPHRRSATLTRMSTGGISGRPARHSMCVSATASHGGGGGHPRPADAATSWRGGGPAVQPPHGGQLSQHEAGGDRSWTGAGPGVTADARRSISEVALPRAPPAAAGSSAAAVAGSRLFATLPVPPRGNTVTPVFWAATGSPELAAAASAAASTASTGTSVSNTYTGSHPVGSLDCLVEHGPLGGGLMRRPAAQATQQDDENDHVDAEGEFDMVDGGGLGTQRSRPIPIVEPRASLDSRHAAAADASALESAEVKGGLVEAGRTVPSSVESLMSSNNSMLNSAATQAQRDGPTSFGLSTSLPFAFSETESFGKSESALHTGTGQLTTQPSLNSGTSQMSDHQMNPSPSFQLQAMMLPRLGPPSVDLAPPPSTTGTGTVTSSSSRVQEATQLLSQVAKSLSSTASGSSQLMSAPASQRITARSGATTDSSRQRTDRSRHVQALIESRAAKVNTTSTGRHDSLSDSSILFSPQEESHLGLKKAVSQSPGLPRLDSLASCGSHPLSMDDALLDAELPMSGPGARADEPDVHASNGVSASAPGDTDAAAGAAAAASARGSQAPPEGPEPFRLPPTPKSFGQAVSPGAPSELPPASSPAAGAEGQAAARVRPRTATMHSSGSFSDALALLVKARQSARQDEGEEDGGHVSRSSSLRASLGADPDGASPVAVGVRDAPDAAALRTVPVSSGSKLGGGVVRAIPTAAAPGSGGELPRGLLKAIVGDDSDAETQSLLASLVYSSPSALCIVDAREEQQPIRYVNAHFEQQTGYSSDEVVGRNCRFLQAPPGKPVSPSFASMAIRRSLSSHRPHSCKILNFSKAGKPLWNRLSIIPIRTASGHVTHYVGTQQFTPATVKSTANGCQTPEGSGTVVRVESHQCLQSVADEAPPAFGSRLRSASHAMLSSMGAQGFWAVV